MGSFNTILGTGGLVIPGGPVIFRAGVTLRSWTITFASGAAGSFTIPSNIREIGTTENPMSIDSLGGGGVGGGWVGAFSFFGGNIQAGGGGGSGSRGMGTFSLDRATLTGDIPFTTSVGANIGINNMRNTGSGEGTLQGGVDNTNSFVGTGRLVMSATGFTTGQAQSGDNGNATTVSLAGTQLWSAGGGGGSNGGTYDVNNAFGVITTVGGTGGAVGTFTNGGNAAGVTRITDTSVDGNMGGMGGPSNSGPPDPNDPGEPAIAPGQTTANDPGGAGIGSTISNIGSEPITQAGSARGGQVIVTFMARDTLVAGDISLSGGTLS